MPYDIDFGDPQMIANLTVHDRKSIMELAEAVRAMLLKRK